MKFGLMVSLAIGMATAAGAVQPSQEKVIPLAGTWSFRLDGSDVGVKEQWFTNRFEETVQLPGTTDTNQKGIFKDEKCTDRLSRVWFWKGPAWYQRKVTIPESWKGKRISLFLERTKNSRVWVDQTFCGSEDTLSASHVFVLPDLAPGEHTLTILIDNAKLPPVGPSHAVDERTQTNWNGIVGKIELRATDPIWIADAQVYPDVAKKQARIRLVIGNTTGKEWTGSLLIGGETCNVEIIAPLALEQRSMVVSNRETVVEYVYRFDEAVQLWDEFQRALVRLNLDLEVKTPEKTFTDSRTVNFGMRDFKRDGKRLAVNGRTVFLRGRLDCANYPLTGYAPMDKAEWLKILGILKDWGLNHVRFHSWCPPEAAFEAADELGFYLQPEFPNKRSAFKAPESKDAQKRNIDYLEVPISDPNASLYDYAIREADLIFKQFGNHPSFTMFTLGNELGRNPAMYDLVARFQKRDPRHLYAQGSSNNHWAPSYAEGDDFWVTCKTATNMPVRGALYHGDFSGGGHIYSQPPSTLKNYYEAIKDLTVPVIAHETAEFEVTPDFREIPKYTGVLKPRNLEIFQQRLKDANMLDLAHDFMRASGALAAICQREEKEAALRTPGFGGFQWLDIMDFPGQGTALVGMLNVFMENKGITTPEAWRQFCSETVPLLLMPKYTWTSDETFMAEVKVAHYGPQDLQKARVRWGLYEGNAQVIASGDFDSRTITEGGLRTIGTIIVPLQKTKTPQKVKLVLQIAGTPYGNQYDIWVYPPKQELSVPEGVTVTNRLDAVALEKLAQGGKMLLFHRTEDRKVSVGGAFPTDFWCWPMFAQGAIKQGLEPAPGTQGFICDPKHPALADFPTEFHSNWQWWQMTKNSRPLILDETPADYRPIIHVIDNFARNHKLGLLFETKVGKGKLLVYAADLPALQGHPEVRQLMQSLLRYAGSPAFDPKTELESTWLKRLCGSSSVTVP